MKRLLLVVLLLAGIAYARRHVAAFIPANCQGPMKVTAFRKPCTVISDSLALCDQVELHFFCVKYEERDARTK